MYLSIYLYVYICVCMYFRFWSLIAQPSRNDRCVSRDAVESLLEQTVLSHQFSAVPGGIITDNLEEENQSETSLGALHRCLC